jgi:hypothetical protein
MSPHLLVAQLRFTRGEFVRCLEGVSAEEARRRLKPMNCISWIVGHLATQEQYLWVQCAQGPTCTSASVMGNRPARRRWTRCGPRGAR